MSHQWVNRLVAASLALALTAPATGLGGFDNHRYETLDGQTASISDYRGKVVVLNLWAVWCSPCLVEIPHLVSLQEGLPEGEATVIGLAIDSGSAVAIRRFWERRLQIEPNYPIWLGTAELARELFDVRTYPATLIIDRNGQVRQKLLGLQTEEQLSAAIAAIQ